MKRILIFGIVCCLTAAAYADSSDDQKLSFINAVLNTNLVAKPEDDQGEYDIKGYGSTNLTDGSVVEYGSILDVTEKFRRRLDGVTAYLDDSVVTNLTPMTTLSFGFLTTDTNGVESVVRLDYEPSCWMGLVSAVSGPVSVSGGDSVVYVKHAAISLVSNVVSSLQLESGFSILTRTQVSHREIRAVRVDYTQEKVSFYEDGVLTEEKDFPDPESTSCRATGIVRDENGFPLSGQKVVLHWRENKVNMGRRDKYYDDVVTTDANGYFEKLLLGAAGAGVRIKREGYVSMSFSKNRGDFPLDITLIPLPEGSAGFQWRVAAPLKTRRVSLLQSREIGICLDAAKTRGGYMVGVTTNKNEADLWFEIGLSEEACLEQYNRNVGSNSTPVQADWREWQIRITGRRGTEYKEAVDAQQDGLSMRDTLREADETGYQTDGVGYAHLTDMSHYNRAGKHIWSQNFYFKKDDRYGVLEGLKFRFTGEDYFDRVLRRSVITEIEWMIEGVCRMQLKSEGHRALVAESLLTK